MTHPGLVLDVAGVAMPAPAAPNFAAYLGKCRRCGGPENATRWRPRYGWHCIRCRDLDLFLDDVFGPAL